MWNPKVFSVGLVILLSVVNVANCWFESCKIDRILAAGGAFTLSSPNNGNYRFEIKFE